MDTKDKLGFDQILEQARLPEDTVDVCLRGDLVADFAELQRQLAELPEPQAGSESLAGDSTRKDLLAKLDAVRDQMRAGTQTFRLRSLSDREYSAFLKEHQPRPEDRGDMIAGFNRETMGPALLRLCVVDPKPTPDQWERLRDILSPGEWAKLDRKSSDLNFREVNVPF